MLNFSLFFIILVVLSLSFISCNSTSKTNNIAEEEIELKFLSFSYNDIAGIGKDSLFNRRDNSDIIKVGNTYYVWYSRMKHPETAGYWATIWYATSKDEGYTWEEQEMALGLGEEDEFDSFSVFTPNILVYNGKYYLYYTAVKPTPGNMNNEFENNSTTDITAIGLAVSDSPDGPFVRVKNNPVLKISNKLSDFDSYRVDDASLQVRDNKICLYYKGRSLIHGKAGPGKTKMGVAYAFHPDGPYSKHDGPILDKSHEVLIWRKNGGVASLASINSTLNFALDGENFTVLQDSLREIPIAPGLYRPHLEDGNPNIEIPGWGISLKSRKGMTYFVRFQID